MPATILSLPVELLSRIFLLGSNYDFPYHYGPFLFNVEFDKVYHSPDFAFQSLVSHVCHSWRQISTTTPYLWNCLHFRTTKHIQRANAFLERCSPRPENGVTSSHLLDILISTDTPDDSEEGHSNTITFEELNQIFELITSFTKRWRSFHLDVRDSKCKAIARRYLSSCGSAPRLETLQLYHFENFGTRSNLDLATRSLPVVIFNNDAPSLKNVSLIGVNLRWGATDWDDDPDFFRLVDLNFLELALHPPWTRPTEAYWTKALRLSPSLQSLSLHHSGPKQTTVVVPSDLNSQSHSQGPVILPSLKRLCLLNLDSPAYAYRMLRGLICGNVEILEIGLEYGENQEFGDFTDVIQLMTLRPDRDTGKRLGGTLKIKSLRCSVASFCGLINAVERLRVLDIDFGHISEPDAVEWKDPEGGFCGVFTCFNKDQLYTYALARRAISTVSFPNEVGPPPQVALPHLEHFGLSGLSGAISLKIILSRAYAFANCLDEPPVMPRFAIRRPAARSADSMDAVIFDGGVWVPVLSKRRSQYVSVCIEEHEDLDAEMGEDDSEAGELDGESVSGEEN